MNRLGSKFPKSRVIIFSCFLDIRENAECGKNWMTPYMRSLYGQLWLVKLVYCRLNSVAYMLESFVLKSKQSPPANLAIIASLFFTLLLLLTPVGIWRSETRFSFIKSAHHRITISKYYLMYQILQLLLPVQYEQITKTCSLDVFQVKTS